MPYHLLMIILVVLYLHLTPSVIYVVLEEWLRIEMVVEFAGIDSQWQYDPHLWVKDWHFLGLRRTQIITLFCNLFIILIKQAVLGLFFNFSSNLLLTMGTISLFD